MGICVWAVQLEGRGGEGKGTWRAKEIENTEKKSQIQIMSIESLELNNSLTTEVTLHGVKGIILCEPTIVLR